MKQPLAYVHPEAQVADNVVIEPFVTIDKNVVIEEVAVKLVEIRAKQTVLYHSIFLKLNSLP